MLLVIKFQIDGIKHIALVNFGCSRSLVSGYVFSPWGQQKMDILTEKLSTDVVLEPSRWQ